MAEQPLNLAIFISGRGSNMQALINACRDPDFPARISIVLSNRADAPGLTIARDAGIPVAVVESRNYAGRAAFEMAVSARLSGYKIDLICLAGFMKLLSAEFIAQWPDRIINIHPSLLPLYKGLNTHERVLADGARESGCSVHVVRPEMDSGPVIVQKAVPVEPGDTPETLAARILEQEHQAYVEAVRLFAEGRVQIRKDQVEII